MAMLLGVTLHALIPYMERPVPHLLWPVREPGGYAFDAIYWWIHGFRVQLFFLISGVLAAASLAKVGPASFARGRLERLGLPLVAASVVVVAGLMYPVWAWGWVESGLAEPRHILHIRFAHGMQSDLYGLAHLWFLEYLLIYSLLYAGFRRLARAHRANAVPVAAREPRSWQPAAAVIALVAATCGWLVLDPRCLIEFHNWFLPRASEFVYHGLFFAAGVAGWSWEGGVQALRRWWWGPLAAAQLMFPWYLDAVSTWSGPGDASAAALAACYGWASVLGWLGAALRFADRSGPVTHSLSSRAFWLYLVHPPMVGVAQVMLLGVAVPAWVKVAASFAFAVAAGLAAHRPAMWVASRFAWRSRRKAEGPVAGTIEPVTGP
jgi:hypothetical protein